MKKGLIAAAVIVLGFSAYAEKRRPNVLFIITDDQFKEQFGFLGGQALTPNIDRLAREGIYFENGFVSSSVCSPSRYTCMSGHFASRCPQPYFQTGTTEDGVTRILWNIGFAEGQPNIPNVLQKAGYKTGFTGKWHLNGTMHLINNDIPKGADPYDPGIRKIMRSNQEIICNEIKRFGFDFVQAAFGGNPNDDKTLVATGCNVHNQEWNTKAAIDFIEQNKDEPWYLYFAPTLMHVPDTFASLTGDPRKSGMGILDEPITGVQPSRESVLERTKAAGIPDRNRAATWLDDGIGAIQDKLEELGLTEDTLVIYFNDNGMEYHSKGTCYQGGVRTQIMAYWPGVIEPGARPQELVQNVDFAPTFFELAGVEPPKNMILDGESLLPILRGESPENWRDAVYSEIGLARSVSSKDWSYVAFYVPPSLQRTKEERVKEAKEYYYGPMLAEHPWMADEYPFLEDAPYFQLGMQPGGFAFERWQLKDPENTPWAPSYFDQDQLFNIRQDPTEIENLAANPEYKAQLEKMQKLLVEYLDDLPGTYPGLKD
ncbi:sulfatase-like hydrolase/transferase [Pontiella sp. NLcol2]|uniref:Sulfatase-like hydrolase/transferase n=2 Tax=Pontiella agarivorans TaxID=3038953 RepID=A0ABU5MUI8_9BACT|nr:sulfatase-like hydrolase/transferase [Pontiella agarivorans]